MARDDGIPTVSECLYGASGVNESHAIAFTFIHQTHIGI